MEDLYNGLLPVELAAPAQVTSDTNTKYIDTADLDAVLFVVHCYATTADSTNYITPVLYGYTGTAPTTASGYSACASTEVNGTFAANKTASTSTISYVSLAQHLYRYYYIKLDETLTADCIISVIAYVKPTSRPASGYTATTGTPA